MADEPGALEVVGSNPTDPTSFWDIVRTHKLPAWNGNTCTVNIACAEIPRVAIGKYSANVRNSLK